MLCGTRLRACPVFFVVIESDVLNRAKALLQDRIILLVGVRAVLMKSDYFVLASVVLSLTLSIWLWFSGYKEAGQFVGLWVPSIIGMGIYIKIALRRKALK